MNGTTPKARAKSLKKLLAGIYDEGRGATRANITDMLTDLRHLYDAEGLCFGDVDRDAMGHYRPEVAAQKKI